MEMRISKLIVRALIFMGRCCDWQRRIYIDWLILSGYAQAEYSYEPPGYIWLVGSDMYRFASGQDLMYNIKITRFL